MASVHTHPEATQRTTVAPRVTEDDLLRMHAEGRRVELGRGGLVEVSPAGGEHSEIAVRLLVRLGGYVEAKRLGRVYGPDAGFRLSEQPLIVRAPDASFVAGGRIPATADRRRFVPVAPDLAVEIVSPEDRAADIESKVQEYLAAGCRLVWVLFPATRSALVRRPEGVARVLAAEDRLDGEEVLPGFACPLREIFDLPEDAAEPDADQPAP